MIKPLRKYHYLIWAVWALLLPLGFVAALAVRPPVAPDLQEGVNAFSANLIHGSDSTLHLTITVGGSIDAPSCLAILSTPQKEMYLGTLNRRGSYSFIVPASVTSGTLNLVDAIHRRTIANIPLSKNTSMQ